MGGVSLLVGTEIGDTTGQPEAPLGLGGAAWNGVGGEFGSAVGALAGSDG